MALTGSLDENSLGNVLHALTARRADGKLTLTQYAGTGVIVLRRGKVIYAASNAARETLGHMLLCQGEITVDQLRKALDLQHQAPEETRLGSILVQMGVVEPQVVARVVKEQICKVIAELLQWKSGFFRFERLEFPRSEEVEVDAGDFLFPEGMPAEGMFETAARQLDAPEGREPSRASGSTPARVADHPASDAGRRGSLKEVMTSLNNHEFFGELTLEILDYARRIMAQGILFGVGRLGFWGMGQFGLEPPPGAPPDFIRSVRLPPGPSSALGEAVARRRLWRGLLAPTPSNRRLTRSFGGGRLGEVITAPLVVSGRVLMVFFGARLLDPMPRGEVERFELLLLHIAIAMERNLLAKRVAQMEDLRQAVPEDAPEADLEDAREAAPQEAAVTPALEPTSR